MFTSENAAEMARRANDARAARKLSEERAIKRFEEKPPEAEEFRNDRLTRVRLQLKAIDRTIDRELAKRFPDAAQLDRLASAAARLNEQERQLSNRSLPPTLKANAPAVRRKPSSPAPEPEPEL